MNRRQFLRGVSGATVVGISGCNSPRRGRIPARARELSADLVVIGGGVGGVAAALAACRAGLRVILTEETDWIGGQLTAQAVPPDEHPWIETNGCTASYRAFRDGVRAHYRKNFPLTPEARANPRLNPGNGWVSRLCHEPRVALAVLEEMLAPYVASQRLKILRQTVPVAASVTGDRIGAVTVHSRDSGAETVLWAPWFADATELGDLLPLAGVEHVIGAEARSETGEEHALDVADPFDQQGFTACFAMEYLPGENHTISRPVEYTFWRDYAPDLRPPYQSDGAGRLLSWSCPDPVTLKHRLLGFHPAGTVPGANLWTYRRLVDPGQLTASAGGYRGSGVTCVNWPQNDYWLGPLVGPGVTPADRQRHEARARQLSLSLLYWMQTEASRPDGGTGWPGLRLRGDVVGDAVDDLAKSVYVRESRRIRAEFTVTENHVGTEARMRATGLARENVRAEVFADAVGVGAYRIDLHPGTSGRNYVDLSSLPFQIPLGALLPRRVENLLAAGKNLGVTHITNGCYRLHPVEWNIGEAAGALAAYCQKQRTAPRQVWRNPDRRAAFQAHLRADGFELEWPQVRPL